MISLLVTVLVQSGREPGLSTVRETTIECEPNRGSGVCAKVVETSSDAKKKARRVCSEGAAMV